MGTWAPVLLLFVCTAHLVAQHTSQTAFREAVQPAISVCGACHNPRMASGGLNLTGFDDIKTVAAHREHWEKIVQKIVTGEMPPPGLPPVEESAREALLDAVRAEFDRIDESTPPDPGRVTARRLNRSEYTNTIRDLLGVRFDATREFPSDDSGHGFDNIGEVLTISPRLMDKYISAAEMISRRALGADPLRRNPWKRNTKARPRPSSVSARV